MIRVRDVRGKLSQRRQELSVCVPSSPGRLGIYVRLQVSLVAYPSETRGTVAFLRIFDRHRVVRFGSVVLCLC